MKRKRELHCIDHRKMEQSIFPLNHTYTYRQVLFPVVVTFNVIAGVDNTAGVKRKKQLATAYYLHLVYAVMYC